MRKILFMNAEITTYPHMVPATITTNSLFIVVSGSFSENAENAENT